jgi:hypothetical protein
MCKTNTKYTQHWNYENIETYMIVDAYTVVDPWTMMIKSFNTLLTNWTVTTSACTNCSAVRTQLSAIWNFKQFDEVDILRRYVARVFNCRDR